MPVYTGGGLISIKRKRWVVKMTKEPFNPFQPTGIYKAAEDDEPLSIWDLRDVYFIEKYSYHESLFYTEYSGLGGVSLWGHETRFGAPLWEQEEGENQYIAHIRFKKPGETLEPFHYVPEHHYENYMEVDIEVGQRDAIIDLLRNEGPVYLMVFHNGRPEREITKVWIGTGSCNPEEVGEGEGEG